MTVIPSYHNLADSLAGGQAPPMPHECHPVVWHRWGSFTLAVS